MSQPLSGVPVPADDARPPRERGWAFMLGLSLAAHAAMILALPNPWGAPRAPLRHIPPEFFSAADPGFGPVAKAAPAPAAGPEPPADAPAAVPAEAEFTPPPPGDRATWAPRDDRASAPPTDEVAGPAPAAGPEPPADAPAAVPAEAEFTPPPPGDRATSAPRDGGASASPTDEVAGPVSANGFRPAASPATGTSAPAVSDMKPAAPVHAPGGVVPRPKAAGGFRRARPTADNPPPVYPEEARRNGREGDLLLRARVSAEGRVLAVSIERASGCDLLDEAAREQIRRWTFHPARRGDAPSEDVVLIPVRFRLTAAE